MNNETYVIVQQLARKLAGPCGFVIPNEGCLCGNCKKKNYFVSILTVWLAPILEADVEFGSGQILEHQISAILKRQEAVRILLR